MLCLAFVLICCVTAAKPKSNLLVILRCRQNEGRNCSDAELANPSLDPLLSRPRFSQHQMLRRQVVSSSQLSKALVTHPNFAHTQWAFLNPGIHVVNSTLHMIARCHSIDWRSLSSSANTSCPNDSLLSIVPCPQMPIYRLNMICHTTLSASLDKPLSPVTAYPQPLQLDAHYEAWAKNKIPAGHNINVGCTDPRIFSWNETVYIACHGYRSKSELLTGNLERVMYVQPVMPKPLPPVQLLAPDIIQASRTEKNWSPLGEVWNPRTACFDYLFSRFVDPHQVLQCDKEGRCHQVAKSRNASFFQRLKGKHSLYAIHLGTNAVRVSARHYGAQIAPIAQIVITEHLLLSGAIFHGLRSTDRGRTYQHFPYLIDVCYSKILRI